MSEALRDAIVASNPDLTDEALEAVVAAAEAAMKEHEAEEAEALELEGLVELPAELVELRHEKNVLSEDAARIEKRLKEIKAIFRKHLEDDGLVGYTINGKVKVRRSEGNRTDIDKKRLREERPTIYRRYLKTTSYVSMRIS